MIKAVIFDMDGLLINSEPVWKEAEVREFKRVGVPLTIEMTNQTMGLRTDEVVAHWHRQYPWEAPSQKKAGKLIDSGVLRLTHKKAEAKTGVQVVIALCEQPGLPMAIASSSA